MMLLLPGLARFDGTLIARAVLIAGITGWTALADAHHGAATGDADGSCLVEACSGLAAAFQVEIDFYPSLQMMCERSPRLTRQMARIAASGTLVTLGYCLSGCSDHQRALTRITRQDGIVRRAELRIRPRDTSDVVELVAHELEHILEQLDGVDLAQLSQVQGNGVRSVEGTGRRFETERATWVGHAVAREYRANAREALACRGVAP
jgi:hypothetical protein